MRAYLSRRKLGLAALGATLVGSGTAMADDRPRKRDLPWTFAPVPVQGGTPGLGVGNAYHVFGGATNESIGRPAIAEAISVLVNRGPSIADALAVNFL
jgi:hypothetical protein